MSDTIIWVQAVIVESARDFSKHPFNTEFGVGNYKTGYFWILSSEKVSIKGSIVT